MTNHLQSAFAKVTSDPHSAQCALPCSLSACWLVTIVYTYNIMQTEPAREQRVPRMQMSSSQRGIKEDLWCVCVITVFGLEHAPNIF